MAKARTIHIRGNSANKFMALLMVNDKGEKALENTSGPMREAIEAELERRKPKEGSQ